MKKDIVLKLDNVSQWYGDTKVLFDIDLEIARGQFVALVGKSGCGKSTLLRAIQGTDIPKQGICTLDGVQRTEADRDVGMMYQNYNLYKFLTVEQNAAFGLDLENTHIYERFFQLPRWRRLREEHLETARKWLARFGLGQSFKKYPKQLSGGMKQRTSFVRSLVMEPKVLLLDEPFGAQDEKTRAQLQRHLLELYQDNLNNIKKGLPPQWTVIIITHEIEEAFYVSDRIVGLSKNWKNSKGETGEENGATVVFDMPSPVYHPDDDKDFGLFSDTKKDLHEYVLGKGDPVDMDEKEFITYWDTMEKENLPVIGSGVVI